MRSIVLVGALVFSASTCLAQTAAPQQPAAPEPGALPEGAAPAPEAGPANLCQEILAFMTTPEPEAEEAQAAAPPQQAASASDGEEASQDGSAALAGTSDTDEGASAETDGETNSAQDITGQEGVAAEAPEPDEDETAAAGSVENAPQKESRAAPAPAADVASTPRESVLTVEEAEQLADANDLEQCQASAREMRVAGVAMPPPLIALAALDLQYQNPGDTNAPAQPDAPAADE